MNRGGRRQLPSWMLRPCTVEQSSVPEIKQEKENGSEELDTKASQTQKKVQRRKRDSGVPLPENKSHRLQECETRKRDRKSSWQQEDQHDKEPYLLKRCRTSKSTRTYKQGKDQGYDLPKSDLETDDSSMRKKRRGDTPGKKKATNKSMEDSHDGTVPSEDELAVEDLVSIAEEYLCADMKKPENMEFNSETRSSIAEIRSRKDPTAEIEYRKPHTHKPLSTGDPARDILDLFLGGFLKRSEEVEKKNDAITKNIMLDHELSKRSQNDTVVEVVPAMKKKGSLKDKVAMLLD